MEFLLYDRSQTSVHIATSPSGGALFRQTICPSGSGGGYGRGHSTFALLSIFCFFLLSPAALAFPLLDMGGGADLTGYFASPGLL